MAAGAPPQAWPHPTTVAYADVEAGTVTLAGRGGRVPALLFRPRRERGSPGHPAVVIGAEAFGINEYIRHVGATLAHLGYVVVVPDYYRGQGPTKPESYDDFAEVGAFIAELDFGRATHDVVTAIEYVRQRADVDPARVVVWGYCTGGTLALLGACLRPELAAAVLFFPSQPVFPELDARHPVQPFDLLWNIGCPVLVIYGDQDPIMAPGRLAELRRRLEQWHVEHEIRIYEGAGHAFGAPFGPLRHDAADRASWQDAFGFLTRRVPVVPPAQ